MKNHKISFCNFLLGFIKNMYCINTSQLELKIMTSILNKNWIYKIKFHITETTKLIFASNFKTISNLGHYLWFSF
jgi:hypothetical protein